MIEKLKTENLKLKNAVKELSVLNEIATQISTLKGVDDIISVIVDKCVKHIEVEQAAVMLLERDEKNDPLKTMVRKIDTDKTGILPLRLNTQLIGWILKNNRPLIVNDIKNDSRFKEFHDNMTSIRSILGVPMLNKGNMIGVLTAFNPKNAGSFTEDDKRLLSIIASQSAQIIENARLIEKEKELFVIQQELRMASEIQKKLLPTKIPNLEGYDIWGLNIPAKEVGGDYFDFIQLDENRYAFCLGDITGKGLPAAMLMSNLQATFRAHIKVQQELSECIRQSNSLLYHSTEADKFATFFSGILNKENNSILYCNAGHDNPIVVTIDGKISRLQSGGLLLGFLEENIYDQDIIGVKPGDAVVIYSDGITEAMDNEENQFGEENLIKSVSQNLSLSAKDISDQIIADIESFIGYKKQFDDMTLIVIKRNM